jgi:hypothetical protein
MNLSNAWYPIAKNHESRRDHGSPRQSPNSNQNRRRRFHDARYYAPVSR